MDPGHVMTARGFLLNMDDLRLKSRRPLVDNFDHKDKVQPQKIPAKQLNVRGFMPSMAGVAKPAAALPRVVEPKAAERPSPSMADLTGVTVDNPRHLKQRPVNPVQAADATLREIIGDLDQFKGRDPAHTDDKRRPKK